MSTFRDIFLDKALFMKSMFKTGDRDALKLYAHWEAAGALGYIYSEYARIFGLCRLIGSSHIYDIGCGGNYQACLLYHEHTLTYTGIDCYEFFDYETMNRMFSDYCGKRIHYICEHYPCSLSLSSNNVAIARGWKYSKGGEKHLKKFAEAVSRDFDRIITNFGIMGAEREEDIRLWQQAMPEFQVMKLGYEDLIFATRIPEDLEKMKKVGYEYGNYNFSIRAPKYEDMM